MAVLNRRAVLLGQKNGIPLLFVQRGPHGAWITAHRSASAGHV